MIFIENLPQISVIFGLLFFIIILIRLLVKREEVKLEKLLTGAFSGSTIPTGLALLLCAFDPSLIQHLEGLHIYIAVAGLALIFVAIKSLNI